ncbi:hypothetical protein B0H11DRAFT_2041490 [Mycena galericulata]|nr:hypothetical protein B0H11DRAFT_2041490 [Mycena galericulata]
MTSETAGAGASNQIVVRPVVPQQSSSSSTSTLNFHSDPRRHTIKPKQRNNAERRASHNAVERQRREVLNGRFLDLAALLPNLATIRRPSKSSIVHSSIAHVRASHQHRAIASQQLRAMQDECDSLRREVNEWRDRAGVGAPLASPDRGDVFALILGGGELELEEVDLQSGDGDGEEDEGEYGVRYTPEDIAQLQMLQQQQQFQHAVHAQAPLGGPHAHFQSPFAHNPPRPRSSHLSGAPVPVHAWHDYDEFFPPHSAHEPVMSHPYMVRPLSQRHPHPHIQVQDPEPHAFVSPHAPYAERGLHYPAIQQSFHGHGQPHNAHEEKWVPVPVQQMHQPVPVPDDRHP